MTADVGVFSLGRTQSQRCPNKMLRPFADTTLTDIALEKLSRCGAPAFFAGHEDAFRAKCEQHGVPFVKRDLRSAQIDGPIVDILSFLRAVEYRYVLLVSSCAPFLKVETIAGFLQECLRHDRQPAISVHVRRKHLLSQDRRALNFDLGAATLNTKTVSPVYELADALYFFDREYFLRRGTYWDWQAVRLVEVPPNELIDIDTEEEFAFAQGLWKMQEAHRWELSKTP